MERLERAICTLEGLSVGDAFGERFFTQWYLLKRRMLSAPPWTYTDDTQMALSIVSVLRQYGMVEQQALARSFARHYEPMRGYGPAMHKALARIGAGEAWDTVSRSLFDGQGSFGNGAAMRVAPLGAYFADDFGTVVEQAQRSAEVTHAHAEAIAGAIAGAIAAAYAWHLRGASPPALHDFLDQVLAYVPMSEVRSRLHRARETSPSSSVHIVAKTLGNGSRVSAQDTVAFTLWCAARWLDNFEEALWQTASVGGDIDTNCAIVGGIVASYTGSVGIPTEWMTAREPLPEWYMQENNDQT